MKRLTHSRIMIESRMIKMLEFDEETPVDAANSSKTSRHWIRNQNKKGYPLIKSKYWRFYHLWILWQFWGLSLDVWWRMLQNLLLMSCWTTCLAILWWHCSQNFKRGSSGQKGCCEIVRPFKVTLDPMDGMFVWFLSIKITVCCLW